jgi:hypothetical protein
MVSVLYIYSLLARQILWLRKIKAIMSLLLYARRMQDANSKHFSTFFVVSYSPTIIGNCFWIMDKDYNNDFPIS